MAEENTLGNISTENIYGIIGRLYAQLWAATNQANEMSQGLALAHERNHALEIAMNKNNLDGLFKQGAGVPEKGKSQGLAPDSSPVAPKEPTVAEMLEVSKVVKASNAPQPSLEQVTSSINEPNQ